MAQILKTEERVDELNPMVGEKEDKKKEQRNVKEILCGITWEKPGSALLLSFKAMLASATIAAVLYFYGYGVNQLISYL